MNWVLSLLPFSFGPHMLVSYWINCDYCFWLALVCLIVGFNPLIQNWAWICIWCTSLIWFPLLAQFHKWRLFYSSPNFKIVIQMSSILPSLWKNIFYGKLYMYGIFLCFFPIPSIHFRSIVMCKKILHLTKYYQTNK